MAVLIGVGWCGRRFMRRELKQSFILGIILDLVLWIASNLEHSIGTLVSLIACVVFGPITVWQVKRKPSIYSLVICLQVCACLVIFHGLKLGTVYAAGVFVIYGIFSVQISMAMANSYENILFLVGKFRNRK